MHRYVTRRMVAALAIALMFAALAAFGVDL